MQKNTSGEVKSLETRKNTLPQHIYLHVHNKRNYNFMQMFRQQVLQGRTF